MSFDGRSAVATASITVVPDGIVKSWKGPHALACGGTSPVYVVASAPAGLDPAIAPIAASTTATPANTSRNLIFVSLVRLTVIDSTRERDVSPQHALRRPTLRIDGPNGLTSQSGTAESAPTW